MTLGSVSGKLRNLCLFAAFFTSVAFAAPGREVVLHAFDLNDGAAPQGTLIADAQQNLYGVTYAGGDGPCTYSYLNLPSGCGTVFELTQTGGWWKEQVLYAFQGSSDGAFPMAGLVMDSGGNLYGTTSTGGTGCEGFGCGVVFELSPPSQQGGSWTETVLYRFTGGSDGAAPQSALIFDPSGNLFGTAFQGGGVACALIGSSGCGTVFELSPPIQGGGWTETTIHAFSYDPPQSNDGAFPLAALVLDPSGNFYGTTGVGGRSCDSVDGCGTVFQLKPPSQTGGQWTENILYRFQGFGGPAGPGGIILARGALWGVTGGENDGYVYELAPSSGGLSFTVIYAFKGFNGGDGATPIAALTFDSQFNLFGTTTGGGGVFCPFNPQGCGTVFELSPPTQQGGQWTEKVLHTFQGTDGIYPSGGLILGQGWLVGDTTQGANLHCRAEGVAGCGVVFALSK